MIRSMTAYASAEAETEHGRLTWELKSVNQRYLDLAVRLPDEFRALEPEVRGRLKQRLSRGKVEVSLRFRADPAAASAGLQLNEPLAQALIDCHTRLAGMAGGNQEPELTVLMQWPGLVSEQRPDLEDAHDQALQLLETTITSLVEAREREGAAIAAMLSQRLDGIAEQVATVRQHLPAVREALRTRFQERLDGLGTDLDPGRLEQEVVLQLQKLDVDEELDRLDTHVAEARRVLELDEPVGRRLDFLMQEFNREANTLGSKAGVAETTAAAVELKVLIEQMREQVQNVE